MPSGRTMTFSGLMSRWTMAASWAAPNAEQIWTPMSINCLISSGGFGDQIPQCPAFDELRGDVVSSVIEFRIEYRDDVGMVQLRRGARFFAEACDALGGRRVKAGGRSLMATLRWSRESCASYTVPIPPEPIRAPTR